MTMMKIGERQDIRVRYGVDKTVDFFVGTGKHKVKVSAEVLDAATVIPVYALKQTIPNAAKVRFGEDDAVGIVVTLTAEAKVGARQIVVSPISGFLHTNDEGRQCQNVTGWTAEMRFQLPPVVTVAFTKVCTLESTTEGHIRAVFTDTDLSTGLGEDAYHYELWKSNDPSDVVAYGAFQIDRF